MKKLMVIFLILFLVNTEKSLSAWVISGSTSVCSNTNNTYTLSGNPAGTTILNIDWVTPLGNIFNNLAPSVTIDWIDQCPTSNTLVVNSVIYQDNDDLEFHTETNVATLNITLRGLGAITPSPAWNCAPYLCSTANITYSISPVCGATNYQWSIPGGWSTPVLSGTNLTSIVVTPHQNTGGVISVTVFNTTGGCNVTRTFPCTVTRPAQVPIFSTGLHGYCLQNSPTAQFCVTSVPNASSYTWILPPGWTGSSTSNCITVNFNGIATVGANIQCRANFTCGTVVSSTYTQWAVATYNYTPYMIANITVTATPTPGKKNINVAIPPPPLGATYSWYVMKPNNTIVNGTTPSSVAFTMTNGQHFAYGIDVLLPGNCGHAQQDIGWQLSNGQLIPWELYKLESPVTNDNELTATVYPNPVSDKLNLILNGMERGSPEIFIEDMKGRLVASKKIEVTGGEQNIEFNVSDLQNGIYNLRLINGASFLNKRFVVLKN